MKYATVGLTLLLLVTSAWAGTFREDFSGGDLRGWEEVEGLGVDTLQVEDEQLVAEIDLLRLDPEKLHKVVSVHAMWLYNLHQLEGRHLSFSCRFKGPFPALGSRSEIGFVLKTEEYNIGKIIVSDLYVFKLRRLAIPPPEHVKDREEFGFFTFGGEIGNLREPFPHISQDIKWDSETWHRLKLETTFPAKTVQVFLDDALISEVALPIEERKLTAGFFLSGGRVKAFFDDLVLSDGPFAIEAKSKLATTWGKMKRSFVR